MIGRLHTLAAARFTFKKETHSSSLAGMQQAGDSNNPPATEEEQRLHERELFRSTPSPPAFDIEAVSSISTDDLIDDDLPAEPADSDDIVELVVGTRDGDDCLLDLAASDDGDVEIATLEELEHDVLNPEAVEAAADAPQNLYHTRELAQVIQQLVLECGFSADDEALADLIEVILTKFLQTDSSMSIAAFVKSLEGPIRAGLFKVEVAAAASKRKAAAEAAGRKGPRKPTPGGKGVIDGTKFPMLTCTGCDDLHCVADPHNGVYISSIDRLELVYAKDMDDVISSFFIRHKLFTPERCFEGDCKVANNGEGSLGVGMLHQRTCVVKRCYGTLNSRHVKHLCQETPFRTSHCKVSLTQIMVLMYHFCCRSAASIAAAAARTSTKTASAYYAVICRVMAAAHNAKITNAKGARFLQVDETFFGTRKNHKGARVRQVTFWVMTVSEMSEADANGKMKVLNTYLYPVPYKQRKRHHLEPIIARHCTEGETQLSTDGGKWYSNLGERLGVEHQIVIHNGPNACFKNAAGAHTNGAEGVHGAIKRVARKVFNGFGKSARLVIRRAMANAEFINIKTPSERLRKLIQSWKSDGSSSMLSHHYQEPFIPDDEAFLPPINKAGPLIQRMISGSPFSITQRLSVAAARSPVPTEAAVFEKLSPEELVARCTVAPMDEIDLKSVTREQLVLLRTHGVEHGWSLRSTEARKAGHFDVHINRRGDDDIIDVSSSSFKPSPTPTRFRSATPKRSQARVVDSQRNSSNTTYVQHVTISQANVVALANTKNSVGSVVTPRNCDPPEEPNRGALASAVMASEESCAPAQQISGDAIAAVLSELEPYAKSRDASIYSSFWPGAEKRDLKLPLAGVLTYRSHYIGFVAEIEDVQVQRGSVGGKRQSRLITTVADSAAFYYPDEKKKTLDDFAQYLLDKKFITRAQHRDRVVKETDVGVGGTNDCGVIALRYVRNRFAPEYPHITRQVIRDALLRHASATSAVPSQSNTDRRGPSTEEQPMKRTRK